MGDAYQHEQPRGVDRADNLAIDSDGGISHALYDGSHAESSLSADRLQASAVWHDGCHGRRPPQDSHHCRTHRC